MIKIDKKVFSIILTFIFILSTLSVSAYAANLDDNSKWNWDDVLTDLPTIADDGIKGWEKMAPGCPAFGTSTVVEEPMDEPFWNKYKIDWDDVLTDLPTIADDGIKGWEKMAPGCPAFGTSTVTEEPIPEEKLRTFNPTIAFEGNINVPKNESGKEGARFKTFKLEPGETNVVVTFVSSKDEDKMNKINVSLVNYSSGTLIDWYPGLRVGKRANFRISNPSYTDYYTVYVSTNQTPTTARLDVVTY